MCLMHISCMYGLLLYIHLHCFCYFLMPCQQMALLGVSYRSKLVGSPLLVKSILSLQYSDQFLITPVLTHGFDAFNTCLLMDGFVLYCIYFEFHQILVQVREQVTNHRI
jgi:hypothetical protein